MRRLAMLALPLLLAACSDAAAASPSEDAGTSGDAASTVDAGALDGKLTNDASTDAPIDAARTTCQGARDASTIAPVLFYNRRSAPFPGTAHPDVAVHVPSASTARAARASSSSSTASTTASPT